MTGKRLFLVGAFWTFALPIAAQHGTTYDDLSLESNILSSERKFAVYLPPDYHTSERSYPVR